MPLKLLAEGEFDLFITADQNIRYQQNLLGCGLPVLELSTNDLRRMHSLMQYVPLLSSPASALCGAT